ncbi:MAG: hypothetical protein NT015_05700 [Alphaproteobacteria bacterium]|nr:hypothetical protein [Alphaproteobacteria bacterium]
MRHWLLHPIIFYPLAVIIAGLAIVVSLRPQSWPRQPAPVSAERDGEWMVYERDRFDSPDQGAEETTVVRDYWGRPLRLRVAQTMAQPAPQPADQGTRILLTPEDAAAISGRPVVVEVSYNPLPVNAANRLAVSLRSDTGPSPWVTLDAPPETATLRFNLPPRASVNAIGIHPVSPQPDMAYGLEITRIRIMPRT